MEYSSFHMQLIFKNNYSSKVQFLLVALVFNQSSHTHDTWVHSQVFLFTNLFVKLALIILCVCKMSSKYLNTQILD